MQFSQSPALTVWNPFHLFPKGWNLKQPQKVQHSSFSSIPLLSPQILSSSKWAFLCFGAWGRAHIRFSPIHSTRDAAPPGQTTTQTPPALPSPTLLPSHLQDQHPNTASNSQHWWNPLLLLLRGNTSSLWHLLQIKVKNLCISAGWCSLALSRCICNGCVLILQALRAELDSQPGQLLLLHGKHLPGSRHGILVN